MTSFEDELTELLEARAERVDAHRADPAAGIDLSDDVVLLDTARTSTNASDLTGEPNRRRQWLATAAAIAVVALGLFGLSRDANDQVDLDTATEEAPPTTANEAPDQAADDPPTGSVALSDPLFVLPPDGFLSAPVDLSSRGAADAPAIDSVVVGRRTESGVSDLVLVELAAERGFLSTTTIEIGGRTVEPFVDMVWVAEPQANGTWLRFTSWHDPSLLDTIVPATTVANGRIVFTQSGDFEMVSRSAPGPHTTVSLAVIDDGRGPQLIVSTSALEPGADPLFSAAVNGADAEFFDNGRVSGYFTRNAPSLGELTAFSWRITDEHVATLSMPGSDAAVVAAAQSLRIVDEATWRAAGESAAEVPIDAAPNELLVWLEPEASSQQIDAVGAAIEQSSLVESAIYQSDTQAYLVTILTDASPVSLVYELQTLSGVRQIDVHPAWSSSPLFLLPPDDVSLDDYMGDVSGPPAGAGSPAPGLAVGRPTATGFDRLMAVALLDEWEFRAANFRTIGGREIFVDTLTPDIGLAAEEVGGRWLHYYVNDIDSELEPLVLATSVVDGEIVFEPFDDVVELSQSSNVSGNGPPVTLTPAPGSEGGVSVSTQPGDDGLILLAASVESVTAASVRGQTAYVADSPFDETQGLFLAWREPSGHVVYLVGPEPNDIVELAESLVAVDEATWRAAVPTP